MAVAVEVAADVERPAFRPPFLHAAVEDRDMMGAEGLEHPPGSGGSVERRIVVDDDPIAVADAEALHPAGELRLVGKHVGQRIVEIGDLADVEEHRAGDMGGDIFGLGVAIVGRQEEGRVDDAQVRRAELVRQPFGRHQRVHLLLLAPAQPKVKAKARAPGSRNSISNVRSRIAPRCRTS